MSPEPTKGRVLVVDDDPAVIAALRTLLADDGYEVEAAGDGIVALALCAERAPDVVVTDLRMPGMDGIAVVTKLHETHPALPVIVVTGAAELAVAVGAMRAGARDYLVKPIDFDALSLAIERALQHRIVEAEVESLRHQLHDGREAGFRGLIGTSPAIQRVYQTARQAASSKATVLVTGESGTGKSQLARVIHALGPRAGKALVEVHCASLPESLLESELFGHEKGSFTGADRRRTGRFEQADGGTIFLDEIGEVPLPMQVKLLRVLQERTLERVGGNESIHVDVRLIAATNKDLAAEVAHGRFREDLYYRLNVINIEMPPLRARGNDVLALADHFLRRFAKENGKRIEGFTDHARAKLVSHRWPGNVRELENTVERAIVLCEGTELDLNDLPGASSIGDIHVPLRVPGATMAEVERYAILATLDACGGSTTRAAQVLGMSLRKIQYRLHEYGVARPRGRTARPPRSHRRAPSSESGARLGRLPHVDAAPGPRL